MEGGCWTLMQSILRTALPSVGLWLCSPAKVSVAFSSPVWALQEMVTLLQLYGVCCFSGGQRVTSVPCCGMCAKVGNQENNFLKMPKRGCMALCSNGRPHGTNKYFNFSSKALCGMLEGFACIYRGCSLYPHARDYRLFPRKTPSWKVVLRENQLSDWARDLNFSTSGRMLTLATLVRLKQNMTPQDVIFARESCHLTIWFLAKLSAALSNTLYFLTNSTFTFILGFFLPFFFF